MSYFSSEMFEKNRSKKSVIFSKTGGYLSRDGISNYCQNIHTSLVLSLLVYLFKKACVRQE